MTYYKSVCHHGERGEKKKTALHKEKNKQACTPTSTYLGALSAIKGMSGVLPALISFQCFP